MCLIMISILINGYEIIDMGIFQLSENAHIVVDTLSIWHTKRIVLAVYARRPWFKIILCSNF